MTTSNPGTLPNPTPVDWEHIYRQLQTTRSGLEEGIAPSPETQAAILRKRAAALAQADDPATCRPSSQVVVFRLAHEIYAVETHWVLEVYPLRELTTLPAVPATIAGIINLRGRILAVVNLKKLFHLPAGGLTDLNKVIGLASGPMEFGILADEVVGVQVIPATDLYPPPPTFTGMPAAYLKGTTPNRLILLDAGKLLANPALIVQEEEATG